MPILSGHPARVGCSRVNPRLGASTRARGAPADRVTTAGPSARSLCTSGTPYAYVLPEPTGRRRAGCRHGSMPPCAFVQPPRASGRPDDQVAARERERDGAALDGRHAVEAEPLELPLEVRVQRKLAEGVRRQRSRRRRRRERQRVRQRHRLGGVPLVDCEQRIVGAVVLRLAALRDVLGRLRSAADATDSPAATAAASRDRRRGLRRRAGRGRPGRGEPGFRGPGRRRADDVEHVGCLPARLCPTGDRPRSRCCRARKRNRACVSLL